MFAAGARSGLGRLQRVLRRENLVHAPGDRRLVAGAHHRRDDRDAALAGGVAPRRLVRAAAAGQRDARFGGVEEALHLGSGDAERLRVPLDRDTRAAVAQRRVGFSLHVGGDAGDLRHLTSDVVAARDPRLPLGGVIAPDPVLDRDQHADHLFAADLHRARVAVVRRAVDPRGFDEILAAEEQSGALRSADVFAAARRRAWRRAADGCSGS